MTIKNWAATLFLLFFAWVTRLQNLDRLATQADEGVHLTVAELVAYGNMQIYEDLFENRTPAVEWLLAGFFRVAGPHIFPARVLTVAVTLLTAAILLALARRLLAQHRLRQAAALGLIAPALFIFDPLSIFWSRFVMLEHFSTAAAAGSVLTALVALQKRSPRTWFGAGLLAGMAIAFKQSELVLSAATLAFFVLHLFSTGRRTATLRAAGYWVAGLALCAALLLIPLAQQGTLLPFVQFTSSAGQLAPLANGAAKAAQIAAWSLRNPYPLLLLPVVAFALRHGNPALRLVLLWFSAEATFLLLPAELDLQPGGFSHYVLPALAAASVVAPLGALALRQALAARRRLQKAGSLAIILAILLIAPAWFAGTVDSITSRDYPQATLAQETQVGRAAALVTPGDAPIVVLGNAIFYHHARRAPASRFFHWPAYLAQSPLAHTAIAGVTSALSEPSAAAALVSRLHLQERLPAEVQAALWENWTPVALFPYAYQRDVFLFVPRSNAPSDSPLTGFGGQIELLALESEWLDRQNLLVALWWRAETAPDPDFTVFVHLLTADGVLLAQHDAVPAAGLRPTSTWQDGEAVLDYHWIQIPEGTLPQDASLSVGLYDTSSGQRIPLDPAVPQVDAYTRPLQPLQ